nr:MAG TPA: mutase [Caudoviricetes sp.]
MIKIKGDKLTLKGNAIKLMEEATLIVIEVIETLVENNNLEPENISEVIDALTKEVTAQTEHLTTK